MATAYQNARKRGEQSYREHLNKGEFPYLQVLDEILSHTDILSETNLGLVEIPSHLIAGTYTAGRRTSFAPNFMPLLEEGTEFSFKWEALCAAHLEEGIHDPVKAYEYMNRYYIVEGNKRVSVLKFFESPSILGYVTRLIPHRTTAPENIVYFEYLDFFRSCPSANYLIFTKPGSYSEFLKFSGKAPGEKWTEDEMTDLHSAYVRFSNSLEKVCRQQHRVFSSAPDSFLRYLHIYDYHDCIQFMPDDHEKNITASLDELLLSDSRNSLELVTEADETKPENPSIIKRIFTPQKEVLHIAFIYHFDPESSSWTYGHELGRKYLEDTFSDEITTKVYAHVDESNAYDVMEQAVKDGADVIFAANPLFLSACLKIAVKYPNIRIMDCTYNSPHRYVRTYYARLYEAKFLSGFIAGTLATDNKIGYTADYPFHMSIANLNAFALGVKTVNPQAKIYVQWGGVEGADPAKFFEDNGIRLISGKDLLAPQDKDRNFGLFEIRDGKRHNLCMAVINWGALYRRLVESIRNGVFDTIEKKSEGRALNYWLGMASDVIDLFISDNISEETRRMVEFLVNSIKNGSYTPFYGVLGPKDSTGAHDRHDVMTQLEIMNMDWLLDNIVGTLPRFDELSERGRSYVLLEGYPGSHS